jgi:hypothetical protein
MGGIGDGVRAANRRVSSMAAVPWPTDGLWTEAQAAIRHSLVRSEARLAPARQQAAAIAHGLDCLAGLFDQLAPTTCAVCLDPCCCHAKVWLDFRDLLFLHLNREPLPPHQLRRTLHEPCRFLGRRGCRLPRRSRPWICTWYICPVQREAIERDIPGGGVQVDGLRAQVKSRRDAMEKAYLEVLGVSAAGWNPAASSDRTIG